MRKGKTLSQPRIREMKKELALGMASWFHQQEPYDGSIDSALFLFSNIKQLGNISFTTLELDAALKIPGFLLGACEELAQGGFSISIGDGLTSVLISRY